MAADRSGVEERVERVVPGVAEYAEEHRPLGSYAAMSTAFAAAFGSALLAAERSGRRLPEHVGFRDLLVTGIATHKLSRLIGKDKVTSFLRAPFTRYQGPGGPGEVSEQARGRGLRLALGELLSCPYCLSQWIAAAFACGLVAAPRPTRLVAGTYTSLAVADFLQIAYALAEERLEES